MKFLNLEGLQYFYDKYIRPLKGAAYKEVANNLTTEADGSVLDARQGKTLEDKKVDKSNIVNSLLTTQEGYALDARQGKILDEKISEINAYLSDLPSCETVTLDDGVRLTRYGKLRILSLVNASSPTAGDLVRLPEGDMPSEYVMASASYRGQERGDFFISITPKTSSVPGKVGLFSGNNAAQEVQGTYIVANIAWIAS